MNNLISTHFLQASELFKIVSSDEYAHLIAKMGRTIADAIENNGKLMLCGNGGSAADAQHLAAELLIRLRPAINRQGIPAIALAMDSSTLTACGNDFGYDVMYERLVDTLGNKNDVLLGITTSGDSENIINALKRAREKGITTIGFLGAGGGEALSFCDIAFIVPSKNTAHIQEVHIATGHALMTIVEDDLISRKIIVKGRLYSDI